MEVPSYSFSQLVWLCTRRTLTQTPLFCYDGACEFLFLYSCVNASYLLHQCLLTYQAFYRIFYRFFSPLLFTASLYRFFLPLLFTASFYRCLLPLLFYRFLPGVPISVWTNVHGNLHLDLRPQKKLLRRRFFLFGPLKVESWFNPETSV